MNYCQKETWIKEISGQLNIKRGRGAGKITWIDTEKDVFSATQKKDTNYVIAHEFFDTLPIKEFVKTKKERMELFVDHNDDADEFFLTQAKTKTLNSYLPKTNPCYDSVEQGTIVEILQDLYTYTADISKLITKKGVGSGVALIADYGLAYDIPSNSLRRIKNRKIVNLFRYPGEVDLSFGVNFQAIKGVAEFTGSVKAYSPIDQGDWLLKLEIQKRTKQLLKLAKNKSEQENVYSSYIKLTDKEEGSMDKIYKFLARLPDVSKKSAGFKRRVIIEFIYLLGYTIYTHRASLNQFQ